MTDPLSRHAVIIGAASGIGWATAQTLAAEGYLVTLADRNLDGARARATELGAPHTAVAVEVTDEQTVQHLFATTAAPDVVVNCAGFSGFGPSPTCPSSSSARSSTSA